MSFVKKGEKVMHNMVKKGAKKSDRGAETDSFGKKGQPKMKNMAPPSKDKLAQPVSEDDQTGNVSGAEKTMASEYDPASGKRAKSLTDLRSKVAMEFAKKSDAGEASPSGSETAQDDKNGSSKNSTGIMKAGKSAMDKKSMAKVKKPVNEDSDEMTDSLDEDQEDSEQTKVGMTPKGQPRKKVKNA